MNREPDIQPRLLTLDMASKYLGGVSRETIRSWCKRGLFRRVRIGRKPFLLREELDAFIDQQLEEDDEDTKL